MHNLLNSTMRGVAALSVGAVLLASTAAGAAEKVSAEIGTSYNTHFVSYGADVWGGENDFYGDRATTFVWGSVNVQATDMLSFNVGAWADVNNNTTSSIGGQLQEVDVWFGGKLAIGKATVGATYQLWNYAGDVEEIVDLSLGFNDEGLLPITLNPGITWHIRTQGNGTQEEGSAVVVSIGPSFKLSEAVSLTIPAGVGFFLDDDFQGGTEDGYAYSYIGASVGVPLSFIPPAYGSWAVNFDLIAYFTDEDAIPNNPEENFLTGSVGLKLTF